MCRSCCQKQVQSLVFININNLGELVVQKQEPYENIFVLFLSEEIILKAAGLLFFVLTKPV